MDRVTQLRVEPGGSRDSTLDSSAPPSEAYLTANDTSKYFSLSEVDSTFDISPIKDVSLASTGAETSDRTDSQELISNLSPINKKNDTLDSFKIGKHIEAANILSGGVNIFDDNDNSYDGNELVIDDNVCMEVEQKSPEQNDVSKPESRVEEGIPSKDTEVLLHIDGKNVDAIDIGNGLYLYRKDGEEELAAVQILDTDEQQPSFKFLKVRENAEGNLEVYEEIEVEIPKEVPSKESTPVVKNPPHLPIKDISKVINESTSSKNVDKKDTLSEDIVNTPQESVVVMESTKATESKNEVNFNGKTMKFNEARKSPLIGSYTPMAYHSTPNKDGVPLTKTMVDLHLHPSRHSDNVKKTIEVKTIETCKQKLIETTTKLDLDAAKIDENKSIDSKMYKNKSTADEIIEMGEMSSDIALKNKIIDVTSAACENDSEKLDSEAMEIDEIKGIPFCDSGRHETVQDDEKNKKDVIINDSVENKFLENESDEIIKETSELNSENYNTKQIKEKIDEKHNLEEANVDNECLKLNKPEPLEDNKSENNRKEDILTEKIIEEDKLIETKLCDSKQESTENKVTSNVINEFKSASEDKNPLQEMEAKESTVIEAGSTNSAIDSKSMPNEIKSNVENLELKLNQPERLKDETKISTSEITSIETSNKLLEDDGKKNISNLQSVSDEIVGEMENSPNSSSELIQLKDLGYEPKAKVVNDFPPLICESNPVTLIIQEPIKSLNASIIVSPSNLSEKIKHSNVIKSVGAKALETKIEPKSHTKVASNDDFVNKYVHKAFIIKNDTHNEKGKELPKLHVTKVSSEATALPNNPVDKKYITKDVPVDIKPKSINNNAVPFGKWTEANKQAYLNKIKETKVTTLNTNQIKQPNDLNRRDVLKKIDSQRQINNIAAKTQDMNSNKNVKNESVFGNKNPIRSYQRLPLKTEAVIKPKTETTQVVKQINVHNESVSLTTKKETAVPSSTNYNTKREPHNFHNTQSLIDRTIEDILNDRVPPLKFNHESAVRQNPLAKKPESSTSNVIKDIKMSSEYTELKVKDPVIKSPTESGPIDSSISHSLDLIVNIKPDTKVLPKLNQISSSSHSKQTLKMMHDDLSEDEILEHEPITGDIDLNKPKLSPQKMKDILPAQTITHDLAAESSKNNVITEKDFDKFARRNSVTYENCLTVNIDNESSQNIMQSIVEKELDKIQKGIVEKHEQVKVPQQQKPVYPPKSYSNSTRYIPVQPNSFNKNYQSKYQIAYQSAMTAKQHKETSINVIENKPVKVVFMESSSELISNPTHIQGQDLSPSKKYKEPETISSCDSMDSDILEASEESKCQDNIKKTKHQRKQVLTPVDTPEMELIEPNDLEESPRKKRKIEDSRINQDKHRNIITKKTYLLNRSNDNQIPCSPPKLMPHVNESIGVTAFDSLVIAAEIVENQPKMLNPSAQQALPETPTPLKRGRGRPRKYPLPEEAENIKASPQKKPRIEKRLTKYETSTDESSDEGIIQENWTMGKINENIVCPICNKLFRSENVVFKHVKHCTGPSPNRSDSGDKRSPRRRQKSFDNTQYSDSDDSDSDTVLSKTKEQLQKNAASNDVIVIEDTPIKLRRLSDKRGREREREPPSQKMNEIKKIPVRIKPQPQKPDNLVCEFCGKTFRQLSYLISHKLQHQNETKKVDHQPSAKTTALSCDVCKKEFRRLHHLVQHRIIHNPPSLQPKLRRKSSAEQKESKTVSTINLRKSSDDQSAGFRCEPCDKSFRKLHHLVEHRETHGGINKPKTTSSEPKPSQKSEKPAPPPQCDVCKKTFRKLHHLIDHKEQHAESSDKSNDKNEKAALLAKDIIHECSLCYMVFPNEHSLNKHSVICLRKKRQSKQSKKEKEEPTDGEVVENSEGNTIEETLKTVKDVRKSTEVDSYTKVGENSTKLVVKTSEHKRKLSNKDVEKQPHSIKESITKEKSDKSVEITSTEIVDRKLEKEKTTPKIETKSEEKVNKIHKPEKVEPIIIEDTPIKKKIISKDKIAATVTKRQKTTHLPLPIVDETKPMSDDEDVRYMLNPDFKENVTDEKIFMKVRSNKRNSLQIERPNSKDLIKRRISLQHPIKVARVKPKTDNKIVPVPSTVPTTDSDDSETKYSFPAPVEKVVKEAVPKEVDKKPQKKLSLSEKRKSLVGIAKKKAMGKLLTPKLKVKAVVTQVIKKRVAETGHRCDCGQLFNSAALLSRHTTLAHTPPRIRKRRSPPPEKSSEVQSAKPKPKQMKPESKTRTSTEKLPKSTERKLVKQTKESREKTPQIKPKPEIAKTETKAKSDVKLRRSAAHRGVPVPEKMRELMEKLKK